MSILKDVSKVKVKMVDLCAGAHLKGSRGLVPWQGVGQRPTVLPLTLTLAAQEAIPRSTALPIPPARGALRRLPARESIADTRRP